ncbi:hypothetical protein DFH28DRAFT_1118339 [Melampsora americana]|nr:hypothetical protein DFH28DRAFT_1118339 [Melampsora americana]
MDDDSNLEFKFPIDPDLGNPQPQESMLLVERVCRYLKKQNSDTKSFLLSYLRSPNEKIVTRRKQWGSVKHGWDTTEQILDEIDKVVNQKVDCQAKWNEWVLRKAKVIVAQQNPPQGSLFININKLETNFFEHQNKIKREETIVKSMSFMHELISFKLKHAHAAWKAKRNQRAAKNNGGTVVSDGSESESDVGSESDACINPGSLQDSAQGYFFQKPKDRVESAKTRLKTIAATMTHMLAFACNRRCNALQVENTITLLACGVSERVNQYLQQIGLSASRKSALRGLLVLSKEKAMSIKKRVKIDATSKTFHGTWGYAHYLDPKILCDLNTEECTVATFQKTLTKDCKQAIDSGDLLPDQNEQKRWVLTLKNQVARVLSHYMKRPDKYKTCKILNLAPIDQVEAKKPDIDMLKLMDSSDNGSDGIAALYDKLIKQTGLLPEDFANRLQVIEGDLGTCLNFRGLESQRVPSKFADEGLSHLVMVPGAGHTLWNILQAILLHHWGDPSNKKDLGAWRTAVELGAAKKERPTAKKDFTSMIRLIEQVHEATITFGIFEVLGLPVGAVQDPIDMTPEAFESTVENVFMTFLSGHAMQEARRNNDKKRIQLLLRMQDFATVVEANRAMSDRNIGRLLLMWKKWSVMSQGLKGLTHYSCYLPRTTWPLRGQRLFSGGPELLAKGPGTDIKRLKDTFSLTVGLLAFLVEKMKARAGQNMNRQSHKNRITGPSMIRFLNMAQNECLNQSTPNSIIPSGPIHDVYLLGTQKLQDNYTNGRLERFHWPVSHNYAQNEGIDREEGQEPKQREEFAEIDEELLRWITADEQD